MLEAVIRHGGILDFEWEHVPSEAKRSVRCVVAAIENHVLTRHHVPRKAGVPGPGVAVGSSGDAERERDSIKALASELQRDWLAPGFLPKHVALSGKVVARAVEYGLLPLWQEIPAVVRGDTDTLLRQLRQLESMIDFVFERVYRITS